MKRCSKCTLIKPTYSFYPRKTRGPGNYQSSCIECTNKYRENRARTKYIHTYEKGRLKTLAVYGITVDQYNKLLVIQNNSCAICLEHESNFPQKLGVDHCHQIGFIRGLLCDNCNMKLGYYEKGSLSPSYKLFKAIESYYLSEGVGYGDAL